MIEDAPLDVDLEPRPHGAERRVDEPHVGLGGVGPRRGREAGCPLGQPRQIRGHGHRLSLRRGDALPHDPLLGHQHST
ncbi:hypothetical protein OVN20_06200 [Microcella daejeonensis]|uniref:hypothetical protein n=1 Tax=Microcella daejeonensis TaxID=2994971 RepID=UPI00226DA24B|nr:hypothetical protein [Microcella daejeonensis]WAB85136.1 hypothetical protein OVN20_06200 [Microcella daejeonensis]